MSIQGFRLPPEQKRLWESDRHPPVYCAQCAILLEGKLDRGALRAAVERVVNRHEILRTTFRKLPGMKVPLQVIADTAAPLWNELDLPDVSEAGEPAAIEQALNEHRAGPFDYEKGPLVDLLLLRLKGERHILSVKLPALSGDARTFANLMREVVESLGRGAARMRAEDGASEDEEVVQYLNFSEWQNELLEGEDSKAGAEYWRNKAGVGIAPLRLPFASELRDGLTFARSSLAFRLEPETVRLIERLAAEYDAEVSSFLLACWQSLLRRLTGEPDIVVAGVTDGRKFNELQPALGLFAKPLPFHLRFDGELRFVDVLRRVQSLAEEHRAWQEYFIVGDGNKDFKAACL